MKKFEFDLREYNKLKKLLDDNGVPYDEVIFHEDPARVEINKHIHEIYGLPNEKRQLVYPSTDERKRRSDVILSPGSYGAADGLLEQMGLLPDPNGDLTDNDVQGWVNAETVFKRWNDDYSILRLKNAK